MGFWYQPQWWQWPLIIVLLPVSGLFYLLARLRRWAYATGLKASYRSPVPVVVVGNISVGGNGKTPLVIALVEHLQAGGYRPGVISRGYGGQAESYPYQLSDSSSAAEAGDEPLLIYRRCHCPVVVGAKRSQNIQALLSAQVDIIISDDGMQHYAMQRDIEIAVVDAVRRHGNGFCLPAGPLREAASRLKQVDFIVSNGQPQIYPHGMNLQAMPLRRVRTQQECELSCQAVHAVAGIGHPPRFYKTLQALGFELSSCIEVGDHQRLSEAQVAALQDKVVLMTEKDAIKYHQLAGDDWYYLPVDAQLTADFLPQFSQLVESKCRALRL